MTINSTKTTFSHKERRYLVTNDDLIAKILFVLSSRHAIDEYHVHTLYLDTQRGTWSRFKKNSKFEDKLRIRWYNHEEDKKWLEVKHRGKDGTVTKHRQPVVVENNGWVEKMLKPISEVHYDRKAYEWRGLRVTIDSNLQSINLQGAKTLPFWIVEIKTNRGVPKWFQPFVPIYESDTWAKSRWSLNKLEEEPSG